jgi:hypothetical protein
MNMSTMTRNFLLCLLVVSSAGLLRGQGGAVGTILGTVKDNSGAVVAQAGVDVTNIATGVTNHTETTASGDFTVPYLQPGTYRITAQATGFQKSVVEKVELAVAQQERVDIALKPGQVSETVEVLAGAVALDTDSSSVSQLISQKQVEQLPLNGRNFLNLLFVGAGAVQTNGARCGKARETPSASTVHDPRRTITCSTDWLTPIRR